MKYLDKNGLANVWENIKNYHASHLPDTSSFLTNSAISTILSNYYTKTEVNALLSSLPSGSGTSEISAISDYDVSINTVNSGLTAVTDEDSTDDSMSLYESASDIEDTSSSEDGQDPIESGDYPETITISISSITDSGGNRSGAVAYITFNPIALASTYTVYFQNWSTESQSGTYPTETTTITDGKTGVSDNNYTWLIKVFDADGNVIQQVIRSL